MTTVILRSNIGFLGILDSRIQNLPVATWHLCSVDLRISCFVGIQMIVIILALIVVGCFFYSTDLWKYQGFSDVWVRLGSVRTGTVSNKEDLIFSGIQHAPRNEAAGHVPEQGKNRVEVIQWRCRQTARKDGVCSNCSSNHWQAWH